MRANACRVRGARRSGHACSATSARSIRPPRSSVGRCRCPWCWRRPASPASPIPRASWPWPARRRGPACRTRSRRSSTRSIEEVARASSDGSAVVPGVRLARPRPGRGDGRARRRRRLRGAGAHRRHRGAGPSRARRAAGVLAAAEDRAGHAGRRRASTRAGPGTSCGAEPIRFANVRRPRGRRRRARRSRWPTTSTRSSIPACRGTTSSGCARCGTARSSSRASRRVDDARSRPSTGSRRSRCRTTAAASSTRRPAAARPRGPGGRRGRRTGWRSSATAACAAGSDIVKAVALGARACMVGRAYLYGLGAAGERGVDHVLGLLRADVRRTMALVGASRRDRPRSGAGQPSRLTALASATARSIEAITVGPGTPSAKSSPVAYTTVGTVHPARLATRARPLVSNDR